MIGRRRHAGRRGRRRLRRLTLLTAAAAGLAALRRKKIAENETRFSPRT